MARPARTPMPEDTSLENLATELTALVDQVDALAHQRVEHAVLDEARHILFQEHRQETEPADEIADRLHRFGLEPIEPAVELSAEGLQEMLGEQLKPYDGILIQIVDMAPDPYWLDFDTLSGDRIGAWGRKGNPVASSDLLSVGILRP